MRLKRSEYETLKNVVIQHTKQFEIIDISKQLEEYRMRCEFLYTNFLRIFDNEDNYLIFINVSEFYNRFNGYKTGLEDGDIFVGIPECNCEEESQEIMKEQVTKKVLKPNQKK